jgi:hypothetical protein
MSPAEVLAAAWVVGIRIRIDGNDLVLTAQAPPPDMILDALARNKAAIVELMRPCKDGWTVQDWRMLFDERAGIAEFDGGLLRVEAEIQALDYCVIEWMNRNPARSPPGCCIGCGKREHVRDPLLPYGVEPPGHVWLHPRCWPSWHAGRKAEAAAALKVMGIAGPNEGLKDDVRRVDTAVRLRAVAGRSR